MRTIRRPCLSLRNGSAPRQRAGSTFSTFAGLKDSDAPNVTMIDLGRGATDCLSVGSVDSKPRSLRGRSSKTPRSPSGFGFGPCGTSPARSTGPTLWDCNALLAWEAIALPGLAPKTSPGYGRPGRDRLSGIIEVDESYVGGEKPGKRGRGAYGKALVLIAAQVGGCQSGANKAWGYPRCFWCQPGIGHRGGGGTNGYDSDGWLGGL